MTDHPWPPSETLLAIADTAEDLRKAIWLGYRTTANDSPARLPGFAECLGQIHQQILILDMLCHGRSVKAARSFADYRTRHEKFIARCNELQINPQDGFSGWGAFFDWQFAEAARPGDDENITFPDRKGIITCIGSSTWKWPNSVADRYNAIWNIFGALKLFFGQGTEVYCRNYWVRPDKENIWLATVPFVRGKDRGFQVPDRTKEELDASWLEALALQSSQLRDAVKAEGIAKVIRPLWWPMRPFKPPLIMQVGPGQPIVSLPASIPLETYRPTLNDQELLQRQIPGIQAANPDWDHVRHYLIARHVNITDNTPITTVLAIINGWNVLESNEQRAIVNHSSNEEEMKDEMPSRIWTIQEYYQAKEFYEKRNLVFNPPLQHGSPAAAHILNQMNLQAIAGVKLPQRNNSSPSTPDILLVTVNELETQAVLAQFQSATESPATKRSLHDRVYHDLGTINGTSVFHTISEMGSGGIGAMQQTVERAINALNPGAVVAVGVAFGIDEKKQSIGDILVSTQLKLYDLQRIGTNSIPRGDKPHASPRLTNHFISFAHAGWKGATVRSGVILSGEKLIDNIDYRNSLLEYEPEAIGGEMEGTGVYVPCHDKKVDWIVVKAICDWADGNKRKNKKVRQTTAATNAAQFVVESLQSSPLLSLT